MGEQHNYLDKILDFFGLKDLRQETKEETATSNESYNPQRKSKVVSIKNRQKDYKVIFHNPDSFEETKNIVDNLKNGQAVIVNLEDKDRNMARRFIDFISGAVYGLNGNIQKIGSSVFLFTPSSIIIDGKEIQDNIRQEFFSQ